MKMAGDMAMDKLRPKPDISFTISMKGGGGLPSIGDFPIIKRVSGGDIMGDDFIGGYTDEMAGVDTDTVDLTEEDFNYTDADILAGQRAKGSTRPDDTVPGDLGPQEAQILSRDRSFFTKSPQEVLAMTSMTPQQIRDKQGGDFGESTPMANWDTIVYPGLPFGKSDWTKEGGLRTDFYNRRMKSKEKNLIDTLKSLGAREQQQLDTLYKGWRNLDPKDYPPEVIDYINQLKQDRPDRFDPISDFDYTKEGQARAKNRLGKIEDTRDKAMELLSDSGTSSSIYRKAGGGGLTSIPDNLVINGQPHKLSYGGPIIRRVSGGDIMGDGDFFGGYTDEMAGVDDVDMYGTATPDMNYTEDDFTPPPEGPATGGLDPTDAIQYEKQFQAGTIPFQAPLGTLDPRTRNTYLNDLIERTGDINEAERLLNESLKIPGAAEDMQRAFDAGIGASFRGEGYRYGGPAGTLMDILEQGVNYDFGDPIKKRLQERKRLEKEGVSAYGFDVETMKAENTFGSILDKVGNFFTGGSTDPKTLEGIQSDMKERGGIFTPISTSDKIVEGAVKLGLPGLLGTGLSIVQGLIGRPIGMLETPAGTFYVGKDGSLANSAIDASPNLGNEPRTTQRRRVATETADATDVDQEEEFTGIKGLLARKGKPTTTSSALDSLMRERVNTLYGRNIFA